MNSRNYLIENLNSAYDFINLEKLNQKKYCKLPFSLRILLESLVRNFDNLIIQQSHIDSILNWNDSSHKHQQQHYIPFQPARVLFQDFSSIPAIVDLACVRQNIIQSQNDFNPLCHIDLILDHSIVDTAKKITIQKPDLKAPIAVDTGYIECPFHNCRTECAEQIERNRELEYDRCLERLAFLKWSSCAFQNISIIPPLNGIAHQTNIECLTRIIFKSTQTERTLIYPDSLLGTDTHTAINNAFGILSLNVGAIEAEQATLGQPIYIQIPKIICVRLTGTVNETGRVTSIDIILNLMKFIRSIIPPKCPSKYIIEFTGPGLRNLTISERETLAQMCSNDIQNVLACYFPYDEILLKYIKCKVPIDELNLIEAYVKKAKLFYDCHDDSTAMIEYTDTYDFDFGTIEAFCSGPKRVQDKINVDCLQESFVKCLYEPLGYTGYGLNQATKKVEFLYKNENYTLQHGSIVMASISSYTNSCNPSVMLAAGLLAKKAHSHGLHVKPFIKCDIWPGSGLLTKHYLKKSGLIDYVELLGFDVVGFGCSACIEHSTEIDKSLSDVIGKNKLVTVGVLSGNRNFESRINSSITKANYLLAPSLVIAYAIAGRIDIDFKTEPIGLNSNTNEPVYLHQIWPTRDELFDLEMNTIIPQIYQNVENSLFVGDKQWTSIDVPKTLVYPWNQQSTYIKRPPFLDNLTREPSDLQTLADCHVLLFLTDSITNDCISPAGSIPRNGATAKYLLNKKILPRDFNSFGSRRGNCEVMARGTYTNSRLINKLIGRSNSNGRTLYMPPGVEMDIFDASECYKASQTPLIILTGKDYGVGSSRDWSVKGPWSLGVRAILAESFDQSHKTNLLCMGILPLKFLQNQNSSNLHLTGRECLTIHLDNQLDCKSLVNVQVDNKRIFQVEACIENQIELIYYKNGGLLNYLTRKFLN